MKCVKRLAAIVVLLGMLAGSRVLYAAEPDKGADVSGAKETDTGAAAFDGEPSGDVTVSTAAKLTIDNENRYDGMDKTYSEGYIPKVENGSVYLVAPILSSKNLKDNKIRVSVDLGDSQSAPFVRKNYEKNIKCKKAKVNDGEKTIKGYVAAFWLELKGDRYNGSYPVTLTAWAQDKAGNEIEQTFTIYVTITDGKDPNAEPEPEPEPAAEPEEPVFAPKVLVQSYKFSKDEILAGDEVTAEITLLNTSSADSVKNMTVSISAPTEQFTLVDKSDTTYIEALGAKGTYVLSYTYRINAAVPEGQYDFVLAMDYADAKGNGYTGEGRVKFSVNQPLKMQFDRLSIPQELTVADVVEAQVSAMNLGRSKVYNVRAVLEADGLSAAGTIFIGDIEPGSQGQASAAISVSGLSGGGSLYGETEGTLTFYYENEAGEEQSEVTEFQATITSPFSENNSEPEDESGQWWVIMAVIAGVLGVFAAVFGVRKVKKRAL